MPNRLLLADGDPKSLRVLEVSLRNAGFQVSTAGSGTAAWDAIQREAPAVIIADPDLPELDGLALCARVRQQASDRGVPFIFIGADKSVEARVRALQAGADDYLVKPTYVNEVIARVRALVQRRERDKLTSDDAPPEAFQGQLRDITVVDLLELLSANRRSGIIHLSGPRGATAAVYFRQGAVIDAEVGRLSGADAIERLFSWTEGTFEIEWKNIRRPDAIGRPTGDLVLEGMKRLDQKSRLAADNPARDGVYEVNYRVLADRLAEIPDEVNGILRLFNGSRPLAQVIEDAQIPDAEALTVFARLRDEGIIAEVKPRAPDSSRDAVPRAVSGDSGSARTGAERSSGRSGAASGQVGQSFADRMRGGAVARTAAETSGPRVTPATPPSDVPPPPPPATTKTDRGFPQLDVLATPSTVAERSDTPSGPSRGEANLELLNGGDEVEREVSLERAPDDNVIPFPTEGRASSSPREIESSAADEGASPPSDEMSPEELAALFGSTSMDTSPSNDQAIHGATSETVPSNDQASDSATSSGESAAPKVPASMLQTQRGFGLPPPPPPPRIDGDGGELEGPPDSVAPARPSHPLEAVAVPAEAGATETSALEPSQASAASPALRTAAASGGVVTVSAGAEATAPYRDPDLSKREALDELGVPGRTRAARILAGALVLGAVAAVVVYRVRPHGPGGAAEATATADKPVAAPAARPPEVEEAQHGGQEPSVGSPTPTPAAAHEDTSGTERDKVEAKNPSAKPEKEKGAAAAVEKAAARPAGDATAEKVREKGPLDQPQKVVEKREARRSPDDKAPAPDAFRQQLAECRALFAKNRFRDASTVCGAAVQSNPRSAEALTMLAHVELNRGHMSRAYELAQKAIAIYPDQPDAYVIIGGVHQDGGRTAQAKAAYQRYLQLAPHGRYAVELRSIVGSL